MTGTQREERGRMVTMVDEQRPVKQVLRSHLDRLLKAWDAMSFEHFDEMWSIDADVMMAVRDLLEADTGVWDHLSEKSTR